MNVQFIKSPVKIQFCFLCVGLALDWTSFLSSILKYLHWRNTASVSESNHVIIMAKDVQFCSGAQVSIVANTK